MILSSVKRKESTKKIFFQEQLSAITPVDLEEDVEEDETEYSDWVHSEEVKNINNFNNKIVIQFF